MSADTATMKAEVEDSLSSPPEVLATQSVDASGGFLCKTCHSKPYRYHHTQECHTCYVRRRRKGQVGAPHPRSLSANCSYHAAHTRCRLLWGPASLYRCVKCTERARDWAYDGTDPTELIRVHSLDPNDTHGDALMHYSAWPEFFMPLCGACHRDLDGIGVNDDW